MLKQDYPWLSMIFEKFFIVRMAEWGVGLRGGVWSGATLNAGGAVGSSPPCGLSITLVFHFVAKFCISEYMIPLPPSPLIPILQVKTFANMNNFFSKHMGNMFGRNLV